MVDPVLEEYENERRIDVALRSDAFTYNAHNDTYTISLSNVEIIRQNELTGKLTIKLRSQQVNQEKSAPADDYLEEHYVDTELQKILDGNDTTSQETE